MIKENLFEHIISHAEMEYLYDPNNRNSGFVDPNLLSAGGFPTAILRSLLSLVKLEPNKNFQIKYREIIEHALATLFPTLLKKDTLLLANILAKNLACFITSEEEVDVFCESLNKKFQMFDITEFAPSITRYLTSLFSSIRGISSVEHSFWKLYKISKIERFIRGVREGNDLGLIKNEFLQEVLKYMEIFFSSLEIDYSKPYYTFDVEWESDLSYYIAYRLKSDINIKTDVHVMLDLHSNTGLFAEVPFHVMFGLYGNKIYKKGYSLIRNVKLDADQLDQEDFKIVSDGVSACLYYKKHFGLLFKYKNKDFVLCNNILFAKSFHGDNFKQYAYLWEHFPKEYFDIHKDNHKKMYLSNLLNAKAAFFNIVDNRQKGLVSPYLLLNRDRKTSMEKLLHGTWGSQFIVKEGGWCSTGGAQVSKIDLNNQASKEQLEKALTEYISPIAQVFVPSILFTLNNQKMHGHIRNISIFSRNGVLFDLGYVLKITNYNKGNSSAFRSYILVYDNRGDFVYGYEAVKDQILKYSLKELNLKPACDLHLVLSQSQKKWHQCMRILNTFINSESWYDDIYKMIKHNLLSQNYLIHKLAKYS